MAITKDQFKKAITEARKQSGDRKFKQSVDLAINLKLLPKGAKVEEFILLPHGRSKPAKICALVGGELKEQASKCDKVILAAQFSKWTSKKDCKNLTREFDYFIAQATIMTQIAQVFGKYFGPVGKMPNPKAGQVVPPKANLEPLIKKLKDTIKLTLSKAPVLHCSIGSEELDDDKLAENAIQVYEILSHALPNKEQNISSVYVKTTMGKAIKL